MDRIDATEASGIVVRALQNLLKTISQTGPVGSDARTAVGDTIANAYPLLRNDAIGPPLDNAFDLCRQTGATFNAIEQVRVWVTSEQPQTLGGTLIQNALIGFCLATEGAIISAMTFASREGVETVKQEINLPFNDAEELAADDMAQATYQALVALHGAITHHLVMTALPLPRMLNYRFNAVLPTLVISHKLYQDASRADQVRDANKIVHPAFSPIMGEALSS